MTSSATPPGQTQSIKYLATATPDNDLPAAPSGLSAALLTGYLSDAHVGTQTEASDTRCKETTVKHEDVHSAASPQNHGDDAIRTATISAENGAKPSVFNDNRMMLNGQLSANQIVAVPPNSPSRDIPGEKRHSTGYGSDDNSCR